MLWSSMACTWALSLFWQWRAYLLMNQLARLRASSVRVSISVAMSSFDGSVLKSE